ncbi:hypothetical protein PR048_002903 [Dryococelus australis]|uniref:Uncharacterized protein n=1 Tax=Dryococelus australis TaxID=614101 RepID=A0ABQ9ILN2_9NEOP|nr:hypothetical protein PR048_002903 [Dryococelus australis]
MKKVDWGVGILISEESSKNKKNGELLPYEIRANSRGNRKHVIYCADISAVLLSASATTNMQKVYPSQRQQLRILTRPALADICVADGRFSGSSPERSTVDGERGELLAHWCVRTPKRPRNEINSKDAKDFYSKVGSEYSRAEDRNVRETDGRQENCSIIAHSSCSANRICRVITKLKNSIGKETPGEATLSDMERGWNARAEAAGVPRESPPASGLVQHDSHMRRSESEPGGDRARITVVGGECSSHCATAAPESLLTTGDKLPAVFRQRPVHAANISTLQQLNDNRCMTRRSVVVYEERNSGSTPTRRRHTRGRKLWTSSVAANCEESRDVSEDRGPRPSEDRRHGNCSRGLTVTSDRISLEDVEQCTATNRYVFATCKPVYFNNVEGMIACPLLSPDVRRHGTHRIGHRANKPPLYSLMAVVKRDTGHSVALFMCLTILPNVCCRSIPACRTTNRSSSLWLLVDDYHQNFAQMFMLFAMSFQASATTLLTVDRKLRDSKYYDLMDHQRREITEHMIRMENAFSRIFYACNSSTADVNVFANGLNNLRAGTEWDEERWSNARLQKECIAGRLKLPATRSEDGLGLLVDARAVLLGDEPVRLGGAELDTLRLAKLVPHMDGDGVAQHLHRVGALRLVEVELPLVPVHRVEGGRRVHGESPALLRRHLSGLQKQQATSGGAVARALASDHGGFTPVLDDAACQRVFSGYSRFPAHAFQRRSIQGSHFMSCPRMTGTYGSQLESPSLGGTKCHQSEFRLKAVHDKVSTFENNRRKKSLLLPAYILTGALSDMRPGKLVTMDRKVPYLNFRGTFIIHAKKVVSYVPDRRRWSAGFPGDLPFTPSFHSGIAPHSPRFPRFGSQDLDVEIRPDLLTKLQRYWTERRNDGGLSRGRLVGRKQHEYCTSSGPMDNSGKLLTAGRNPPTERRRMANASCQSLTGRRERRTATRRKQREVTRGIRHNGGASLKDALLLSVKQTERTVRLPDANITSTFWRTRAPLDLRAYYEAQYLVT